MARKAGRRPMALRRGAGAHPQAAQERADSSHAVSIVEPRGPSFAELAVSLDALLGDLKRWLYQCDPDTGEDEGSLARPEEACGLYQLDDLESECGEPLGAYGIDTEGSIEESYDALDYLVCQECGEEEQQAPPQEAAQGPLQEAPGGPLEPQEERRGGEGPGQELRGHASGAHAEQAQGEEHPEGGRAGQRTASPGSPPSPARCHAKPCCPSTPPRGSRPWHAYTVSEPGECDVGDELQATLDKDIHGKHFLSPVPAFPNLVPSESTVEVQEAPQGPGSASHVTTQVQHVQGKKRISFVEEPSCEAFEQCSSEMQVVKLMRALATMLDGEEYCDTDQELSSRFWWLHGHQPMSKTRWKLEFGHRLGPRYHVLHSLILNLAVSPPALRSEVIPGN